MLFSLIFILNLISINANFRIFGWYNGIPEIENIPWKYYTHIRYGEPIISNKGEAICNLTQMKKLVDIAHSKGKYIFWGPGNIDINNTPDKYWQTIGRAAKICSIDGIDVDYEHGPDSLGIVTPKKATRYTIWLSKLRRYTRILVSADISIWGMASGNYLLGVLPWINVTMLNNGEFDFINTMSYHWCATGDIWAWKKDVWFLTKLWKINPERINLGIGYFSKKYNLGKLNEPLWRTLSKECPNISVNSNICNDTIFVGKYMNYLIGKLIAKNRLGGAFPWELSYDSYENNNTLVKYLISGLNHN